MYTCMHYPSQLIDCVRFEMMSHYIFPLELSFPPLRLKSPLSEQFNRWISCIKELFEIDGDTFNKVTSALNDLR